MTGKEVYPSAPLRLVTAEFRFPLSPVLAGPNLLDVVAAALGEQLPIIEPTMTLTVPVSLSVGPEGSLGSTQGYRLLDRDRRRSVTVESSRIAIEATQYTRWEELRKLIRSVLESLGDIKRAIPGLTRVGIRYINEVRVPGEAPQSSRWEGYINSDLLCSLSLARARRVKTLQAALHMESSEESEVLLRYGALEGAVVGDSGPLRPVAPPKHGPFFLLDIDSFWHLEDRVEEYQTENALSIADALHDPVSELFENAITDRLRDEVLRREPE